MIASPVLVIGCARSGTTLLYTVLSEVDALWSLGYESRAIIERDHGPAVRGWESGALSADDPARNLEQRRTADAANELTAIDNFYGASWAPPTFLSQ